MRVFGQTGSDFEFYWGFGKREEFEGKPAFEGLIFDR